MENKVGVIYVVIVSLVFLVLSVEFSHGYGEKMSEKKGILLVAFGLPFPKLRSRLKILSAQ